MLLNCLRAGPKLALVASVVGCALLPATGLAEYQGPVGANQRVLVLCAKFNDVSTTRKTAQQWVDTLTTEVNDYIRLASFGQTSFTFERPTGAGMPADGWVTLPFDMDEWPGTTAACWAAIRAADPYANMSRYNRVFLIVNNPGFGGQCTGWNWFDVDEGVESTQRIDGVDYSVRQMCSAVANEWQKDSFWPTGSGNTRDEGASVMAHELGHQLGIPIHYSDVRWTPNMSRDSITPWDIMGLSPGWNNVVAWAKVHQQWLPLDNVQRVGPPTTAALDQTIILNPIQTTSGRRAIRIPFSTGEPFDGYYLEYRQNAGLATTRDAWGTILNPGVLVTRINDRPEVEFGTKAMVMYNPSNPDNLNMAALDTGQSFTDPGRNITITVVSLGTSATVRVQYGLPPTDFDPAITPWGAPPYETTDMWVDSEQNGWGTYRYVDGSGRPSGNGDPAWVRQLPDESWNVNRVHVRVRNYGLDAVWSVQVNVYVNDPPGLGDRGANWAFLGSIVFPSIPGGGSASNYVNWAPQVDRHTCLRAVIVPYANERTEANNMAQENVSNFETTASSPYEPVSLKMRVQNPTGSEMPVEFEVLNIPRKWKWELIPRSTVLPPNADKEVELKLYAPNPDTNPQFVQGQIFVPRITAMIPHGDVLMPYGGVELWTHLVYKSKISLTNVYENIAGALVVKGKLEQLQPTAGPLKGQKVAVLLTNDNKQKTSFVVRVLKTSETGTFQVSFPDLPSGNYIVEASWAGNMTHQSGRTEGILIGL